MNVYVLISLVMPVAGTVLGAAAVFFLRRGMTESLRKAFLGFASGVMISASFWSLLIPAIEMSGRGHAPAWIPASVGFLTGVGFLLVLDKIIPHLHLNSDKPEGKRSKLERSYMLILAVALHNIPEGMTVGAVIAGFNSGNETISIGGMLVLAAGIAIQNFPEGAVISFPLVGNGLSKKRAFLYGAASSIVEPIGAFIMILLTSVMTPALPYILSFAAGAMIYVVFEELIPESHEGGEHSNIGAVCMAVGFVLMMVFDIAFA